MMDNIVRFALHRRALMIVLLGAVLMAGAVAFMRLNIEAYPDPVPPLVQVITQSSGQSAEDMERYVTIPIEVQMAGVPHVASVRTISLFGLSVVNVQFTYDFTHDEAEQRVINRLSQLGSLPNGAQPQISPESPIGEIYRYRVVGPPGYSVTDLKTLQDWILQRRFKAVPGVIDVSGWGGRSKTYDVAIDKQKLLTYGLTLPQVLAALNNSNLNVGGQTVNFGPQAAIVRGVGLIHSSEQLRKTLLTSTNGVPVLLADVAEVKVGALPRLGIAGQDHDNDIVEGIVLMHRGEKSSPTIKAVEDEVAKINSSGVLPPGVHVEKIYDRSDLIAITTRTVLHNMLEGMVLIFAIQWLFLGNLRSAVIVATTIPFALFFAVLIMTATGESANLLSVGAIDFGLVVDATVIMVENIFRHLAERPPQTDYEYPNRRFLHKLATIGEASAEVNRSIFFSAAIIIASFLPLFTLVGVEGHIFGPMAKTYAYAIAGGLLATFTISPALSAFILPNHVKEEDTPLIRGMRRLYEPLLEFALANRVLVLGGALLMFAAAVVSAGRLGLEFLPHLEEGNFWIRASFPQSVSLEASDEAVNQMRTVMLRYPEVQTVISQHGRPDDGTDATGFFNAEFFVPLKPFDSWPHGMDKVRLTKELNEALSDRFPGVDFNFSQNIEDNVEEAASGVKGENSVKVYGADLSTLQRTAEKIRDVMKTVPGVTDLAVFNSLGQPTVRIDIDRDRAARYGLAPGDINNTVQAAIGGQAAGALYEQGSDRNFPIMVRLAPGDRQSLDAIKKITIGAPNPNGAGLIQVPLNDVASVSFTTGASFVYREQQQRYIPIKFSVRGRDLGGAVLEAQRKVAQNVPMPGGYRLEWVGELGQLQSALQRLAVMIPLSLLLIGFLLFINFSLLSDTLLAISVIPLAAIGGILTLFITGTPLSVSAVIGFIALFGISVMNGIMVVSAFNSNIRAGLERAAAIKRACATQLRPVMITCIAACVGLLPAAVSTGIGSQVQRPLALVVVGGILLAPILILLVLPVLLDMFSQRHPPRRPAETSGHMPGAAE
jgi:cobalt-zinc-cadmium resistance protein CzcA